MKACRRPTSLGLKKKILRRRTKGEETAVFSSFFVYFSLVPRPPGSAVKISDVEKISRLRDLKKISSLKRNEKPFSILCERVVSYVHTGTRLFLPGHRRMMDGDTVRCDGMRVIFPRPNGGNIPFQRPVSALRVGVPCRRSVPTFSVHIPLSRAVFRGIPYRHMVAVFRNSSVLREPPKRGGVPGAWHGIHLFFFQLPVHV